MPPRGSAGIDACAARRVASPAHVNHAILHGMADWDAVRFFLELARAKTLARAARRLRVDYTTVGRRVSAFERELGAKLFERTPDGFVLTDAGESIRAAAEQMEQSALAVEQRALGADRRLSGTVRIAAAESAGHAVVLPAMRELRRRHPEIRLHLQTVLARLDIARREADLALRFTSPESGDLRFRRLTAIGFALYASADYLARHRPPAPGAGFAGRRGPLRGRLPRGAGICVAHSLAARRPRCRPSEQHAVAGRSRSERPRRGSAQVLPGRYGSAAAPRLPRSTRGARRSVAGRARGRPAHRTHPRAHCGAGSALQGSSRGAAGMIGNRPADEAFIADCDARVSTAN